MKALLDRNLDNANQSGYEFTELSLQESNLQQVVFGSNALRSKYEHTTVYYIKQFTLKERTLLQAKLQS